LISFANSTKILSIFNTDKSNLSTKTGTPLFSVVYISAFQLFSRVPLSQYKTCTPSTITIRNMYAYH